MYVYMFTRTCVARSSRAWRYRCRRSAASTKHNNRYHLVTINISCGNINNAEIFKKKEKKKRWYHFVKLYSISFGDVDDADVLSQEGKTVGIVW